MPAADLKAAFARTPHFRELLLRYAEIVPYPVSPRLQPATGIMNWVSGSPAGCSERTIVASRGTVADAGSDRRHARRAPVHRQRRGAQLQKAGIIRYQHGRITIIDRTGLENAACECYEAVAGEYRRLVRRGAEAAGSSGMIPRRQFSNPSADASNALHVR